MTLQTSHDSYLTEDGDSIRSRSIILEDALVKKDKRLDRCGVFFKGFVPFYAYHDACALMHRQLLAGSISRFSIRGIVGSDFNEKQIVSSLGANGGLVEINKLPIDEVKNFLWISESSLERTLSAEELERLVLKINNNASKQSLNEVEFQNEADRFYEIAVTNRFRIVCNDPTGEYGKNCIEPVSYTALMRGYFYTTKEDCAKYLKGSGYSTSWHYLFGLVDQNNNQLGTFMLAKWPWGIEGTYTTLQRGVPRSLSCAQIMMLFSTALVLRKHKNELFYGEANSWNARPCIQSGYHILPSRISQKCVSNIVMTDNPIRLEGELAENEADLIPPSYQNVPYASYGIHKLRNELFTPAILAQAENLLAV